uniref:Potassium channel subfamily K member n=1 Tax=Oryzias sinensis TaxID=183150 RepID=A0A8C7ZHX3_9TELE
MIMWRSVESWCALWMHRHQSTINFAFLVVAYIFYLLVGAGIFSAVELPYEKELRDELKAIRRDFLSNHTCVSDAHLDKLLARALEASNYGVSVLGNNTSHNWDFVSSLFFASTVLTTTGYGHTVPLSDEGKGFCIFFSLLGIPVTLFFLSTCVERLVNLLSRRPVSYFHRRWAMSKSRLALIHATVLAIIIAVLFIFIPSWIFVNLEKRWNFLDSLYFCFISLTTIGLGDYVPGETHSKGASPHPHLYRLAITVYLLLGLVCVLVVMETCCELPQMRRFRQRFYQENVRELDSETTNIIDRDHMSEQLAETADHISPPDPQMVITSVSEQAETLRHNGTSIPYIPPSGSAVN